VESKEVENGADDMNNSKRGNWPERGKLLRVGLKVEEKGGRGGEGVAEI
jgi:hypothetical protein